MKSTFKYIFAAFLFLFLLWFACAATDLLRLHNFNMPVFARPDAVAADGVSGSYKGVGWHIDIKGNFTPDAELPGITQFEYYLFDDLVLAAVRD